MDARTNNQPPNFSSVENDSDESDTAGGGDSPVQNVRKENEPGHLPSSPGESNTKEIEFPRYHYNTDALRPEDLEWFKNIQIYTSVDQTDSELGHTAPIGRQVSRPNISHQTEETDAFGQILFGKDDVPAWFVRLSVDTGPNLLQELFEKRLELVTVKGEKPLRIHFIDFDEPDEMPPPHKVNTLERKKLLQRSNFRRESSKKRGGIEMGRMNEISERLYKDIRSICRRTAGLVMTWCGMVDGPGKFVHEALEKLLKDSRDDAQNLASISVPPWSFVPRDTKEKLKTKGGKVELEPRFHTSGILGEKVSTAATHFLLLDNGQSDGEEDEKARLIDCRHFQRDVIEAMDNLPFP